MDTARSQLARYYTAAASAESMAKRHTITATGHPKPPAGGKDTAVRANGGSCEGRGDGLGKDVSNLNRFPWFFARLTTICPLR